MNDKAIATTDSGIVGAVVDSLVLRGDISALTAEERTTYYVRMCESLGLNPTSQPFAMLRLNGKEILYPTRGATDQLARIHRVNREITDGPRLIDLNGTKLVYALCRASMPDGRVETATATVPFSDPINVLMKAETKAKRRATLSILGLGMLDESEVQDIPPREIEFMEAPRVDALHAARPPVPAEHPVEHHEAEAFVEPTPKATPAPTEAPKRARKAKAEAPAPEPEIKREPDANGVTDPRVRDAMADYARADTPARWHEIGEAAKAFAKEIPGNELEILRERAKVAYDRIKAAQAAHAPAPTPQDEEPTPLPPPPAKAAAPTPPPPKADPIPAPGAATDPRALELARLRALCEKAATVRESEAAIAEITKALRGQTVAAADIKPVLVAETQKLAKLRAGSK